jgi:hypothetical protein
MRKELVSLSGEPFPHNFLKASDEQTVVALAAVLQAIKQHGVIAAPRFFGRLNAADVLVKVETAGAAKAPPLFVPHRSLHAVSGTISQALEIKGPNFGVGGGINAPVEGLLTALTLLDEYQLPGLWVVLTQNDPEPLPDGRGNSVVPAVCHALALAFMPVAEDWKGLRLLLTEPGQGNGPAAEEPNRDTIFAGLTHFIEQGTAQAAFGTWSCSLKWGCILRLTDEA